MIDNPKIVVENFNLHYGKKKALNNISIKIPSNKVTALIGRSRMRKIHILTLA